MNDYTEKNILYSSRTLYMSIAENDLLVDRQYKFFDEMPHLLQHLISVCTDCKCPFYGTLGKSGLKCKPYDV